MSTTHRRSDRWLAHIVVSACASVLITSCGDSPTESARLVSVVVAPITVAVPLHGSRQLTATAKDAQGNTLSGRVFGWKSTDTSVARVSADGLVTGAATGTAAITATTEQVVGVAAVTVAF